MNFKCCKLYMVLSENEFDLCNKTIGIVNPTTRDDTSKNLDTITSGARREYGNQINQLY